MDSAKEKRNLSAVERHRRQAAWQIWAPVGLAVVVVLTLFVLSVLATVYDIPISKTLAPVAVIWVLIPQCFGGFFTLAISAVFVILAAKLLGGLPRLGTRILQALHRLNKVVQTLSDRLATPVLKVNGWGAGWSKFWEMVWHSNSHNQGG